MTVKELIEKLKTMPEDMEVCLYDKYGDGGEYTMNVVSKYNSKLYNKTVILLEGVEEII